MKEFIEFIIKHLVDKPDEVQVNEIAGKNFAELCILQLYGITHL